MEDEGDHDLGLNVDAVFLALAGGFEDGPHLHLGQLGDDDAQSDAARAQHRVLLAQGLDAL